MRTEETTAMLKRLLESNVCTNDLERFFDSQKKCRKSGGKSESLWERDRKIGVRIFMGIKIRDNMRLETELRSERANLRKSLERQMGGNTFLDEQNFCHTNFSKCDWG